MEPPSGHVDGDYQQRIDKMQELDAKGIFKTIESASSALQAVVRTQVLDAALVGQVTDVVDPITKLASHDNIQLAEEASLLLDKL